MTFLFAASRKSLYLDHPEIDGSLPLEEKSLGMRYDNQTGRFRNVAAASTQSASPRICMPTWRNFTKRAYQCGLYEAQDVLVENDDVDLLHLDMSWGRGSRRPR